MEITRSRSWPASCSTHGHGNDTLGFGKRGRGRKQRGEDDRELSTIVQLLENERGETLVRFAYSTDDQVRRGPVTLRESDLLKLRKALAKRPRLHAALHWRA